MNSEKYNLIQDSDELILNGSGLWTSPTPYGPFDQLIWTWIIARIMEDLNVKK
jgi:hypothetical protein